MMGTLERGRSAGFVAVTMLTALLAGCGGADESAEPAATAAESATVILGEQDVAVAVRAPLAAGVVLTGSLQPHRIVTLSAQVPGTIASIRADRGTHVRAGQLLATVRAEGIRGQAEGAQAGVAAAEAGLALARQRLESARTLREAGALSEIDYQTAIAGYEAARAQLAAARAAAAGALEAAGRASITSPIDGAVSARMVEEGEAVDPGQPLFTVVNSQVLELSGQVPIDEASRIRPGQHVVFRLEAFPGRELRGQVDRVEPTANPDTRQVGVYVRMQNPGGIIGGQFATGRILTEVGDSVVVLPETAVHESAAGEYVLVIENDQVVRRAVTIGGRDASTGRVSVLSGIDPGERVVIAPSGTLREGTRVRIQAPSEAASALSAQEG